MSEMVGLHESPAWPYNDQGPAKVPNIGSIKTKALDFDRWCPKAIQTCVWLGTPTPGKSSQTRSRGNRWLNGRAKVEAKAKSQAHTKAKPRGSQAHANTRTLTKGHTPQSRKHETALAG